MSFVFFSLAKISPQAILFRNFGEHALIAAMRAYKYSWTALFRFTESAMGAANRDLATTEGKKPNKNSL